MELQLQVMEEELLEFPEVRFNQFNTGQLDTLDTPDTPAGKVVTDIDNSTEHRSSPQNNSRSHGRCSTHTRSNIKTEKPYYKRSRRKKQKDRRLVINKGPIPSILDIKVRPNLMAFAKTLTPEALRYLYLGIDLGQTSDNCP